MQPPMGVEAVATPEKVWQDGRDGVCWCSPAGMVFAGAVRQRWLVWRHLEVQPELADLGGRLAHREHAAARVRGRVGAGVPGPVRRVKGIAVRDTDPGFLM